MVTKAPNPAGALVAALALAAVASLGACGQRAMPSPSFEPSPADARTTELAGAPETAPAPLPPVEEAPPPPPPPAATTLPSPEAAPSPPPPARGDDEVFYDLGPVTPTTAPSPTGRAERPHPPRVRHSYRMTRAEPRVAAPVPRPAPAPRAHTPSRPARAHAPAPATVHAPSRPVAAPTHAPVGHAPTARAPASHVPAPPAAQKAKPASAKATKPAKAGKAKPSTDPDRGAKLQALQTALRDAVTRRAELSAPDRPPAGQPSDVTLTLPADFAKTVRDEAAKAGLADAAATVNLTAQLTGEGYAVTPGETQAQPLTVGQPTEFHWTATAQPNARGPLRADVGADLLGAGSESLALGAVARADGGGLRLSSRAWGAGLLVLIAVVVLAWLARGNRSAAQREGARRSAARSRNGIPADRPFDMTGAPLDTPADPPRNDGPRSLDDTQVNGERRGPFDPPR